VKIKGYRFPCEVCGDNKVVSSVQVFFRKNGEVSYARARHLGADKKFYYHQQSLDYVNRKLREIVNIDHDQNANAKSIEHSKEGASTLSELEPSAGFGPATITLPR
jgi:hypothetical protein